MAKTKKPKRWTKFRHKVVRNLVYLPIYIYVRIAYGVRIKKFKGEKKPYLILLNHQTPFDQFFVGMSIKGAIYYMATDDIFSLGFLSKIIKYIIAPIPIKKQATDPRAVLSCMRIAREGGTIAIAPEGNRTYSGRTVHINPAIAPLIKKLNLPIIFYKIEGGYGVEPRWSDVKRKGKMTAGVSRVINLEEYQNYSNEELIAIIRNELFVDENLSGGVFKHKKRAEYLERCFYVCPRCGLATFYSKNEKVTCEKCGLSAEYLENKEFKGKDFPFKNVGEWYDYQNSFINALDLSIYNETQAYVDKASIKRVIPYKKKVPLYKCATVKLFGDRIEVLNDSESLTLNFDDLSAISVLGRNKLNVYVSNDVYQFKGDKRFNALKYVNFYYRYNNLKKGDENEQFLGL